MIQTKEVVTLLSSVDITEDVDKFSSVQAQKVVTLLSSVDITEDVDKFSSVQAQKGSLETSVPSNGINKKEDKMTDCDYLQPLDHTENITRQVLVDPDKLENACSSIFHSDQQDSSFGQVTEKKSNSSSKIDFLAYFDAETCLVGSYGNQIPRHVCITSGGKQLRDAVGFFYIED